METKEAKIINEISKLTRDIENKYPELQKYLDEGRSTLPKGDPKGALHIKALEDYRDSLKELIQRYNNKQDK